jgi:16S rRNA (adenine1518-N6/adenine1519-N6)-dimethyltransferase
LFDKSWLEKIVKSYPINKDTIIIEIGSGYGSLTKLIAETDCEKVISIEKDEKLFQWLLENNKSNKIDYFHKDALQINWLEFCSLYKNNSLIMVGNLPYYIANSLIIDLLFERNLFKSLIFLIQKEVGQKWASSPKKYPSQYSALPVFINYLAKTEFILEVPRGTFNPSPLVDGALVSIEPHQNINATKENLASFLNFLKNCFRFRRKTLLNNLNSFAGNFREKWEGYFIENNYSEKIRPQNLTSLEYWELFIFWQKLI